jgi:hypothetical protein
MRVGVVPNRPLQPTSGTRGRHAGIFLGVNLIIMGGLLMLAAGLSGRVLVTRRVVRRPG